MPSPNAIIVGDAGTVSGGDSLGILANRRVIDMRDEIFHYEPDKTPLTLLLNKAGRRSVFSPKYEWLEDALTPSINRINKSGGYTTGETSIVVDTGDYIPAESLVRNQRTGEVMLVDSIAVSTETLTIGQRGFGGTAAATINDNDQLTVLGTAYMENQTSPTSRVTKKAAKSNFTQIFRDSFGASRTLQKSKLYGGDYMTVESRFRGVEHAVYIENSLFFGEKKEYTTDANVRRSLGGVDEWATTNVKDFGGAITLEEVFDAAESNFRYGSRDKMLFVSRAVGSNLSLLAGNVLRTVSKDKTFGISIQQWVTPHGTWNIIVHNLLQGDEYATRAYSLDLDQLTYVYLQGSDTMLKTNIQANDADGRKDEYLTECGLERKLEETCGVWKNASS